MASKSINVERHPKKKKNIYIYKYNVRYGLRDPHRVILFVFVAHVEMSRKKHLTVTDTYIFKLELLFVGGWVAKERPEGGALGQCDKGKGNHHHRPKRHPTRVAGRKSAGPVVLSVLCSSPCSQTIEGQSVSRNSQTNG